MDSGSMEPLSALSMPIRLLAPDFRVPEAAHLVVVHEAGRLHERVADRRPREAKPAPPQVAAQRLRFLGLRWELLDRLESVLPRHPADEAPEVRVERLELLAHREQRLRIAHR